MIIELTKTRTMDRPWVEELQWLDQKGYRARFHEPDAAAARKLDCKHCGCDEVDYFGFSIAGMVNRSYAVCPRCRGWEEY